MALRTCIQCKTQKRGLLSLAVFPKESFGWCSDRCIFEWLKQHKVTVDGEPIDELESKDGKKKIFREDYQK